MTGLDTNVLIRYIMQDDVRQSATATRWIEGLTAEAPGFVSLVVVLELVWVLSSSYGLADDAVAQALETLLRTREILVDRAETVWKALRDFQSARADFADCLIDQTGRMAGCETTMTFDRVAARQSGMTLLN